MEKHSSKAYQVKMNDSYRGLSFDEVIELLHSKDQEIHAQAQEIHTQAQEIHTQAQEIHTQAQALVSKDQVIAENALEIASKNEQLAEKDLVIDSQAQEIHTQAQALVSKDQVIAENALEIASKNEQLAEKDLVIDSQAQEIHTQAQEIHTQAQALVSKDQVIAENALEIASKDEQLAENALVIASKDEQLAEKDRKIAKQDYWIGFSMTTLSESQAIVKQMKYKGEQLIKSDYTLDAGESLSYQATIIARQMILSAEEIFELTARLNRSAREIDKSRSERNTGKAKELTEEEKNAIYNNLPLVKAYFEKESEDNYERLEDEAVEYDSNTEPEEVVFTRNQPLDKSGIKDINEFEKERCQGFEAIQNRQLPVLEYLHQSRDASCLTKQQAQAENHKRKSDIEVSRELPTLGVLKPMPEEGTNLVKCFCSNCNEQRLFKLTKYPKRLNETLHCNGLGDMGKVIAEVYRGKCTECKTEQEVFPHDTANVQLYHNPESAPNVVRRFAMNSEVKSAVASTVDLTLKTSHNTDKYQDPKVNSTVESTTSVTTDSTKSATAKDTAHQLDLAWSECNFEQLDALLQRSNTSRPVKVKASALMTTISKATTYIKEPLHQMAELPADAPTSVRAGLYMQISTLATKVILQQDYVNQFIQEYKTQLNSSQSQQLSNIKRKLGDWRLKLQASVQKDAPSTVVRNCNATEIIVENGVEIIHPASYDAAGYGYITAFKKCQATVNLMVSLITMLSELSLPKSRLYQFFAVNGLDLSKAQCISWILGFARAYMHPAAIAIKKAILDNSEAVLMDETTLKVHMSSEYIDNYASSQQIGELSDSSNTPNSGIRRSQVWTLVSSWTSPVQGAYCMLSPTRNHKVALNLLKEAGEKVCYLTTDGYRGYETAIKKLQENGYNIHHTPCWTHLRRPLHQYLEDTSLLDFYNEYLLPKDSDFFVDFLQNLDKVQKEQSIEVSRLDSYLLLLYYDINLLYAIDTTVVLKHKYNCQTDEFKKDLREQRQRCSSVILASIYDIIFTISQDCPDVLCIERTDKGLKVKANQNSRVGKALSGIISCYDSAWHMIDHPEIELSESVCERVLRPGVLSKNTFFILRSSDGGEAFCDFLTLFNSCRMNGVPFHRFTTWLVANINYRMAKMIPDPTMRMLPSPMEYTDTDEHGNKLTKTYNRYDEKNVICYDKVDMTGLLPHDYARYLRKYGGKEGMEL